MDKSYLAFLLLLICSCYGNEDLKTNGESVSIEDAVYATPKSPPNAYLAETFDDFSRFEKLWVKSEAKKEGVDADIAKYDGKWSVEEAKVDPLYGDRALVLKSKALHAAISAPLVRPFKFGGAPLVVQYEVTFQDGQECGGAYLKLLSLPAKLAEVTDKTPYTIMFGPDKCGNDAKIHFIFRHVNPLNGSIEEKHGVRPKSKVDEPFKDKKPHLYTLILRPENTFEVRLDHQVINSGSLLEDVSPPVNPDKEIPDPNDTKPEDWDEREKIPDPDDSKPEDWDESAPRQIEDISATVPSGWLEEESPMIPDPTATMPEDWDPDMDGDWEAPLLNNPACEGAPGCGPWKRPMIDNPSFKGKWFPKMIPNPNYQGQWFPQMIPNPDFFEDLEPFKMTPISAVAFELWTMSADILFDNILITDSVKEAEAFAADTFDIKLAKLKSNEAGYFDQFVAYTNENPWLWALYVIFGAIFVVLVIIFCCVSGSDKETADHKKTDEATPEDMPAEDEATTEDIPAEDSEEVLMEEDQEEAAPVDTSAQVEQQPLQDADEATYSSQEDAAGTSQDEGSQAESQDDDIPAVEERPRTRRRARKE